MRNVGPAIKVATTFLLVGAAGYWALMMLAKGSCGGDQHLIHVHAYFQDATLLVEKSRVQIAGLNVGHIVSRELSVRPPRPELVRQKRFAKITVAIKPDVKLYGNAVIFKRSASLLGEFYLEIDPGTYEWVDAQGKRHAGETIGHGAEIRNVVEAATAPTVVQHVGELLPTIKELLHDIQAFTRGPLMSVGNNLNDGIAENREALREALRNIEAITRDVRGITRDADDDVRTILTDVKTITASLREVVGDGSYGRDIRRGIGKLNDAVGKLDRALGDVEDITGDLQQGKGNLGRLLKDEALIDSVEDVVHDTGTIVKSIASLQTVVGLRSEYNFEAGTIKTYVTLELWPRPDKYYLIELIDDPRGRRDVSTTITRSDDPAQPLLEREDRVVLSDAFRLSFQFAKRMRFSFVDTTFRFGVKESRGGIGFDLALGGDRFILTSDLFDFAANIYPRLKVFAAWQFFAKLYVTGGIDDALNERPRDGTGGGRDYFLGFQLRFNDEDLRQLLLVGGSALTGSTRQP